MSSKELQIQTLNHKHKHYTDSKSRKSEIPPTFGLITPNYEGPNSGNQSRRGTGTASNPKGNLTAGAISCTKDGTDDRF